MEGDVEIEDKDESALVVHEPAVYDEEVVFADQGEALVVQRTLNIAMQKMNGFGTIYSILDALLMEKFVTLSLMEEV